MSDSEDEVDYELEDFVIGGHPLSITTIAFMPITTLMANREKNVEISGQKLWCGSLVVINYLLQNPELVAHSTVLELGAGTGVLGMMCNFLGATSVILTDWDSRSIDHMQQDCERNKIPANIVCYNWKTPDLAVLQLPEDVNAKVTIVAGDVMYKRDIISPFMDVVDLVLSKYRNAELLLCHVPRAGVEQAEIVATFTARGFQVECICLNEWREGECLQYTTPDDLDRAALYCVKK